ncbi:MAG TPA: Calx-beta domain-containing protein, partial [Pyrinomonadaceae bacterium]|nr:Calx-beta domain-containing protein [Pyrinomonadaceae bacterium]
SFVTKVSPAGDSLVYSTFLGGRDNDDGTAIAVDGDGNAYVSGSSFSNDFPTTPGAFRTTGPSGFVTKFNPAGSALVYSTFIGGPPITDLALTASGEAYVSGHAGPTSLITTPDAFQPVFGGGGSDAFVMKLNANGTGLVYSTYLGGIGSESASCITVDSAGSAYVAGTISSGDFPVTPGAFQITPSGDNFDLGSFVAKFGEPLTNIFRISGRLTDNNGAGLNRALVRLSGPLEGFQWTDFNGNFSFGNLPAGASYTITPLNQRFNFNVPSQTFDNLNSNQTADFVGTARNLFFFPASNGRVVEGVAAVSITVNRTGDSSVAATVDYATSDGTASGRSDYAMAFGTLRFAAGETSKTFNLFLTDDSFGEAHEQLNITLSNPTGGFELGSPSVATVTIISNDAVDRTNPIGFARFFVFQHYIDFLNRLPDQAGLDFWTNEITSCGTDAQCIEIKRINVSAAFFLSIEFENTGFLVYRVFKTAYGDTTSPNVAIPVPIIRLNEFLPDAQRIGLGVRVGIGDWEAQLEANKNAYAREFVVRQRFLTEYPLTMTPAQFVDKLNLNAGGVLSQSERDDLIAALSIPGDITLARAMVLRKVAEDADLRQRETTRAFVLMQYYGYLRRNPDDPQDTDFGGWEFWLNKLNQFNGNFVQAEMVKAFIDSIEYRQRFGP